MNDEEKLIDSYKRYMNHIEQQIDDYYELDDSDDSFYKEEIEQGELSLILLRKILKLIKDLKFKNEVYKKKAKIDEKVIDEMAKELAGATGTCPFDIWDWKCKKCEECENTYEECFKQYFYRKVEEDE